MILPVILYARALQEAKSSQAMPLMLLIEGNMCAAYPQVICEWVIRGHQMYIAAKQVGMSIQEHLCAPVMAMTAFAIAAVVA